MHTHITLLPVEPTHLLGTAASDLWAPFPSPVHPPPRLLQERMLRWSRIWPDLCAWCVEGSQRCGAQCLQGCIRHPERYKAKGNQQISRRVICGHVTMYGFSLGVMVVNCCAYCVGAFEWCGVQPPYQVPNCRWGSVKVVSSAELPFEAQTHLYY